MNRGEQGYSFIELMIAISLALFLSVGMMTLFSDSRHSYQLTQRLNANLVKVRMAFYLLSHDIRMAGLIGCVNLIDNGSLHRLFIGETSLVVWHKGNTTANVSLPKLARYQKNSDVILVQFLDPNTVPVKEAKSTQITFARKTTFLLHDVLLMSDCQHAEMIHWNHIHLRYRYQENSEIGFFNKIIYYIADTGRKNEKGQVTYALYRRHLNESIYKPTELIEGISEMTIRLGMKKKDGTFYYEKADEVKQWDAARSVEIKLRLNDGKRQQKEWMQVINLRER